jgi:predicted nucleotidyltransferase
MPSKDEAEIIRVLCDQHQCHTVLLYGSRARNQARPGSDWDVLGIRKTGEPVRDVRQLGDGWLDAFVHPESHFAKLDDGSLRFVNAKVLVDKEGFAGKLLARVAAFEAAGPKALRPEDDATLRAWYPKMLDRIMRDDTEARYRRAWLLYDSLEAYFRLRHRWYRGPKQSLAYLEKEDPHAYHAFERALAPDATLDDLSDLVRIVLSS